jgi:plasmid stability protein
MMDSNECAGGSMADLLVCGIEERLVKALEREATAHGRHAEAELRAILEEALQKLENRQFIKLLMSMPDVGEDADFERLDDTGEAQVVFD